MKRVILFNLLLGILALPVRADEAVPDATAAEKIGATALKEKLGEKSYSELMKNMEWAATANGNVWNAGPVLKPIQEQTPCPTQPGQECVRVQMGGWNVRISRKDGHVISIIREE